MVGMSLSILRSPGATLLATFLVLHGVSWGSSVIYSRWCLDISLWGFFKNMVNGHGPVCHALQTVSTTAVSNIYSLLQVSAVSAGVSWLVGLL